ncbi:MAG: hypothetical protein CSB19_02480 [Clostridiales bacterium]|nr:MAG: hypothetical protein CSB19_02480 [Clostridiales bacterium]
MKIALAQIDNTFSIEDNLKKIVAIVEGNDADYFVFPESCITGYSSDPARVVTITRQSEVLQDLKQLATKKNCHIFAGANLDLDGKHYIAYMHFHEAIDYYFKTHLGTREVKHFSSGDALKVFDATRPTGVSICIESHFPDGGRQKLWHKYLPARAYDNQVFLFATNLTGQLDGLTFSGGMMAVDPRGNIIYENYEAVERVAVIEIDENAVAKARRKVKVNYIARRRPELYGG